MQDSEVPMPELKPADLKASRLTQVLTEWKTLAILGGPILIAQLAQMANGVIDTVMAGHASAEDLAGVGIGAGLWVPVLLFFMGVLNALQPIVSGYRGAQQWQHIMPVTWQGLYIAAGGSVVMILLLTNARPVLDLLQLEVRTAGIAQGYLDAFAWGVPALLMLAALRGLTDGLGHTRVIMVFSLISTLFNLPLNYIFIYGKLGLPAMGGVGCGWATAISNWIAVIALLVYLNRSKTYASFHLLADWVKPDWQAIRQVLRLGVPIGFTMFVEVSMFAVIALFLAPLGPKVVAGHQIVLNAISLLFMVPLSLGMALTLRVSYLVGAEAGERAQLLARSALLLALGISMFNVPVLLFGRDVIAGLYTNDPDVFDVAVRLFFFAAIFQIADVIQVTMINTLRGFRDTRIPMFIMLISFWAICLPLGYTLTFTHWLGEPMGASGFWTALCVGLAVASILMTYRVFNFRPPAS
ncbi:MAG: MATE family efflux transporter [Cellvibrio sp.]